MPLLQPCQLLLTPYQLNAVITLKNRIVMAPMTRRQADLNHSPTESMASYYAKRAEAGLIVTEGTIITEDALGYGNVPGIYAAEQINAWAKVTTAVHAAGGLMFSQLWHCGRVSHPNFHQGRLPVSASATLMRSPLGNSGFTCGQARTATTAEIQKLIADYAQALRDPLIFMKDSGILKGICRY
jgi:N-ethylmaleimide reductase